MYMYVKWLYAVTLLFVAHHALAASTGRWWGLCYTLHICYSNTLVTLVPQEVHAASRAVIVVAVINVGFGTLRAFSLPLL